MDNNTEIPVQENTVNSVHKLNTEVEDPTSAEIECSKSNSQQTFNTIISEAHDEITRMIKFNSNIVDSKSLYDKALNDVTLHSLEKVKECFFQNEVEEQKLAEFMLKVLSVDNLKAGDSLKPESLSQIVDGIVADTEPESFDKLIDSLFGPNTAKTITEKLCYEKIDDVVESLLGEDTKKLICDRLESNNLEDLLNNLIDEKMQSEDNPKAEHPKFDDFIDKILGKETEELIKQKLEYFLKKSASD